MITDFKSPEASFLSNFTAVKIPYAGKIYASVEHAYQSAKSDDPKWKDYCANPNISAGDTKRESRTLPNKLGNWKEIRVKIMYDLLCLKFMQEPFRTQIKATKTQNLQEGNWWGDDFWGVDLTMNPNYGENMLGRLLMQVRSEIQFNDTGLASTLWDYQVTSRLFGADNLFDIKEAFKL